MIEYKAFEMHSHTFHSDGTFSVESLCQACKVRELDGVALTDHNTMSGWEEITPALEEQTLPVIRGIEWTTFYGHMLVIGADRYVDWRLATPENIDRFTEAISAANGAVGIAHPFSLGSPFCTGCHWEFRVKEWKNIHYVEVWSGPFPLFEPYNEPGFQMWTDLLNQGHRLAASCGIDWHENDLEENHHMPVTCLGVENGEVSTRTAREALRAGRVYVTGGPALDFQIEQSGKRHGLGAAVNSGAATLLWGVDQTARTSQWNSFGLIPRRVAFIQNGGEVLSIELSGQEKEKGQTAYELWPGWIRLELYGDYQGRADQLLGFTSPIYVEKD
ncbi:MAG: CehA/McbA family metallohydrolase [Clostridiales bacterium]|nr:CehA/McbA family metallohydrolase [Clostridiales bacterium]